METATPAEPLLLDARGLVKSYDGKRVVDGLDLDCGRGQVLGLLGPNGAGKSTTIRMLYGLTPPDAGVIRFFGRDFARERDAIKRSIGVCTQDDTLDYDLTVARNLHVYAGYFRPRVADVKARVAELLEQFGLERYAGASPHALSGGFKRRLLIARSIIHAPRVLFLDEPTTGLDPAARVEVWGLVSQLRAEGMAIILTTHYMDEAERLSDSLLVLRDGRALARGGTRDVLGQVLGEHILVVSAADPAAADIAAALEARGVPSARVLDELHAPLSTSALAELGRALPAARLSVRPPTLDDLFLHLASAAGGADAARAPSTDGGNA